MPQRSTKLIRVREVAQTLALHPISVYNLIAAGDLKATRMDGRCGLAMRSLRDSSPKHRRP